MLSRFPERIRAVVFGASGGIGAAACSLLQHEPKVAALYAGSRSQAAATEASTTTFTFDLLVEESIAAAAARIASEGALDLVVVATGILHDGPQMQPERTWGRFSASNFAHAFAINATGPALIAQHFLPLLAIDRRSVFLALSARIGSISDNSLGGWAAYRASKAALNQIIRTCAIELARRNKSGVCVAYHPGTVNTALSAPFQQQVNAGNLFTPHFAASRLLTVVDGLRVQDSGKLFAWDGTVIAP
ncbi:MAG: SDR family NAD(P)-dependent oxidoreductase [Steroidobacteraceae bacterium]